MSAGLEQISGNLKVDLGKTTFIGRLRDSQLCLQDEKVSRQHAMVRQQGNDYWLFDLGSSNGTYVNGHLANVGLKLNDGDRITFGDHKFVFVERLGLGGNGNGIGFDIDATHAQIHLTPMLILVSDIKGFTEISETLPPEVLANSIGAWYRECERVISESDGAVDKFIGDAVLAYWTDTSAETRGQAMRAATELHRACHAILESHRETFEQAGTSFEIGAALHLGDVAHGAMSQGTFTLLGDAVNVTFRLESLTRTLGKEILVTREFLEGWKERDTHFHPEGAHPVKGRRIPLEVFSLAEGQPD